MHSARGALLTGGTLPRIQDLARLAYARVSQRSTFNTWTARLISDASRTVNLGAQSARACDLRCDSSLAGLHRERSLTLRPRVVTIKARRSTGVVRLRDALRRCRQSTSIAHAFAMCRWRRWSQTDGVAAFYASSAHSSFPTTARGAGSMIGISRGVAIARSDSHRLPAQGRMDASRHVRAVRRLLRAREHREPGPRPNLPASEAMNPDALGITAAVAAR